MKVTKENFRDFISAYEEDELFYRDVYLHHNISGNFFRISGNT